jgi:hypothetical protein
MGHAVTQFVTDHQTQLWSAVIVLFGALVARVFRLRPKLIFSVGHSTNLIVEQRLMDADGTQVAPRQMVRTASITVQNAGLQAAKAVELTFNWKPAIMNVWPARAYSDVVSPFDRYSLKFDSLAPGEVSTIEIMSVNAELPLLTSVRADECVGKMIKMAAQRVWPSWYLRILLSFLLIGVATTVFLTVRLIQIIAG